jgi:uncharacterized membrane protein (UPF0127 family)
VVDHLALIQAEFNDTHPYDRATITLAQTELDVAVARTPQQWARGMVGCDEPHGLLFIMPPGSSYAFHMRGMNQPLAIGFFDSDGRLVDAGYLEAKHGHKKPKRKYTYALEIPFTNRPGLMALLTGPNARLRVPCASP